MPVEFRSEALFSLHGESALVTGGAGQLGSAIVSTLVAMGVRVAVIDQSLSELEQKADAAGWSSGDVILHRADLRNREQVKEGFERAEGAFGSVTHLINNAGVSVFEPFLDRPEESIDYVMDVNLKGTLFCILEYLDRKRRDVEAQGTIVNIASHYGLVSPDPRIYTDCDRKNSEIYGATKAGIIQMTKYFSVHAAELGVRVNAVSPGGIRNPENPQGEDFQKNYGSRCPMSRMGETWEVMGPIVFLMSRAANYITGHNIVVDGGMTSW